MRLSILLLLAIRGGLADGLDAGGFEQRAMTHVRSLAAFAGRVAGTEGEAKARTYVRRELKRMGLAVKVEPFIFEAFTLDRAVLRAGNAEADIERLGFNPYAGGDRRSGELVFVESTPSWAAISGVDMNGKIVVTTSRGNLYLLSMAKKPIAIARLKAADFARLRAMNTSAGEVVFQGHVDKLKSANIIATRKGTRQRGSGGQILISAHYDSWRGPGAHDNASGVAVLLELARQFGSAETPVRFVFFGAEEIGLLGSKAYVARHRTELERCRLLFNVDSVGGNGQVHAEIQSDRGGVSTGKEKEPAGKATSDIDGRWMLIGVGESPMVAAGNIPDWLRTAVLETGKELGVSIQSSRGMGSDHRVFLQAGVVATDIAIAGGALHTPQDTPESISPQSLLTAGRIVAGVVEKERADGVR